MVKILEEVEVQAVEAVESIDVSVLNVGMKSHIRGESPVRKRHVRNVGL